MRLVAAAARRRMPWKNGGGETFEVAAGPDGAALAGFDWRVSMARVAADGPFSVFPGIDRTICLLAGDGLVLEVAGEAAQRLLPASPPLSFPGDAATGARLIGGPVTDLNVMTRRGRFTHTVERIEVSAPRTIPARDGWTGVVCARGALRETSSGLRLSPEDTLVCGDPAEILLSPVAEGATVLLIRIAAQIPGRRAGGDAP